MEMEHLRSGHEEISKRALNSSLAGVLERVTTAGPRQLLAGDNTSSNSCMLLVEEDSLRDGRIPQVLGIALAAWAVSQLLCLSESHSLGEEEGLTCHRCWALPWGCGSQLFSVYLVPIELEIPQCWDLSWGCGWRVSCFLSVWFPFSHILW